MSEISIGNSAMNFSNRGNSSPISFYNKNVNATEKTNKALFTPENQGKISPNDKKLSKEELDEAEKKRKFDGFERCETCANRRYKDGSNDSGVSFQSATKVHPSVADSAVRSHEQEHVTRNADKADREGRKVVFSSVSIFRQICPECGKMYTAGGVTRTKTVADNSAKLAEKFSVGLSDGKFKDKASFSA